MDERWHGNLFQVSEVTDENDMFDIERDVNADEGIWGADSYSSGREVPIEALNYSDNRWST